jgi:hypothetical protein
VKFAYMPLPLRQSARTRYRPIVPIHILAPRMLPPIDACIDSAADDTVFPPQWAVRLGVDLAAATKGQAQGIGGTVVQVSYAPVTLLLSDGYETCEWDAVVAFSATPMRWALLGHAGFLDHLDVQLLGARREVIVMPNTAFRGQHFSYASPPP